MFRARSTTAAMILMGYGCAVQACSKHQELPAGPADRPAATGTASVASPAPGTSSGSAPTPAASGVLRKLIWTEDCEAEKSYVDCVVKACSSAYRECYGEQVDEGGFSGPCEEYGKCTLLCTLDPDEISRAACDLDCADRHKADKDPCDRCMANASRCADKAGCKEPPPCK